MREHVTIPRAQSKSGCLLRGDQGSRTSVRLSTRLTSFSTQDGKWCRLGGVVWVCDAGTVIGALAGWGPIQQGRSRQNTSKEFRVTPTAAKKAPAAGTHAADAVSHLRWDLAQDGKAGFNGVLGHGWLRPHNCSRDSRASRRRTTRQ